MNEEKNIEGYLSDIKKDNPFSVPKSYFDGVEENVRNRINKEVPVKTIHRHRLIRSAWMIGSAAVLIGFGIFLLQELFHSSPVEISNDEIAYILEQDIYDLDEFSLENTVVMAEQSDESADNYEDEVIQYLLDEDVELESGKSWEELCFY